MNIVVTIIIAVQEMNSKEFSNFKKNFTGCPADVYSAYESFRDSARDDTTYFENVLWDWYCELTK